MKRIWNNIVEWYWSLGARRRHQVGWSVVIISVVLCLVVGYGAFVGVYRAGEWICSSVASWFDNDTDNGFGNDKTVTTLDYYSGDYKHRKFPCGELNPKRKVNLKKDFNDVNDTHMKAAKRLGIKPQANREALDKMKNRMVHLHDTRYYHLDRMTQSVPYLVHDAADFLTALGQRWQEYHGTNSRFIITSCTRTDEDVKRLKRVNKNASKNSVHRYGTTVDITYVRFERHGNTTDTRLAADLARALRDMQLAGHCYVKYEIQQKCFHITVRPN